VRCLLNSAPPSLVEFSAFASRPDTLEPRFAIVNNAVSTVSDYLGNVDFLNASITASTTSTVGACASKFACFRALGLLA